MRLPGHQVVVYGVSPTACEVCAKPFDTARVTKTNRRAARVTFDPCGHTIHAPFH